MEMGQRKGERAKGKKVARGEEGGKSKMSTGKASAGGGRRGNGLEQGAARIASGCVRCGTYIGSVVACVRKRKLSQLLVIVGSGRHANNDKQL